MTKRIHRIMLTVFLALGLCTGSWADTLYLRDGEQQSGRLVEIGSGAVVFEVPDGIQELATSEVIKVQLQRQRQFDDVQTADEITDADLKAALENQPSAEDLPAAGFVTLLRRHTFDLTTPGLVVETVRTIEKVLRQRGEDAASKSVWFFEDTDAPRIDFALTVTPDGRVLHLDDAALKNESLYARLPVYRRLARRRFACKEPRPGSILDVQYTVERKRGGPFDPFYAELLFRHDQPMLRSEVVVAIPETRAHELTDQLEGRSVVAATRTVRDCVVYLKWDLTQPQRGIAPEPLMPPKTAFVPTLAVGETGSWNALSEAYAKAVAALEALPEEVAAKARELASEQAIHSFVARSVRTVAVPHRRYGLVPHPPAETLERAMANELDKNFLYFKMLEAAGVKCRFALVRDRDQGPLYKNLPSLKAFNRSAVFVEEPPHFTSAASDVLPFRVLTGPMQGAPALVIGAETDPLRTTNAAASEDEHDRTEFEATLGADGALELAVTFGGRGNAGTWLREMKDYDAQRLRSYLEQLAAYIHPSAILDEFETTDLADLTQPPAVTLGCRIPEFAVTAGDELMLFTLPGLFYTARDVGRPSRQHDLHWEHIAFNTASGLIHLPEGFDVYALPQDVDFKAATVRYAAKLKENGNTLLFEDRFERKTLDAPSDAYADFKASQEIRANIPRQRIILMRN